MEKIIKMGFVGIGRIGWSMAKSELSKYPEKFTIVAACDLIEDRTAKVADLYPGCKEYTDYAEMLSSNLCEAILIATPHYFHPPMAIAAFEAGLHVLTEKPAGVRVSDVLEMNAAADRSGKVFGIMFNQRTGELFQKARQLVQNGSLGELRRLTWIITNWYRTDAYYKSGDWRGSYNGEGGGVLLNQAPHNLDLLQWIAGMPTSLFATCGFGKHHSVIEVEDEAILTMEYENGATAQFITTTGEYPGTNRLEIVGDRGKIVLESGTLRHYDNGFSVADHSRIAVGSSCKEKPSLTEYTASTPERAHAGVLTDFAAAIRTGSPLVSDGREGIAMLTLANAAYLSAWEGRKIDLPLSEADRARFNELLEERITKSAPLPSNASTHTPDGNISSRWKIKWD